MVTILQASSLWQQSCSFFFLSSGFFNDLLVIRVALTIANLFLLVTGSLGHPRWNNSFRSSGAIAVDTIFWSTLNLLIHGLGVIRILYDERTIELTEEEEALWRFIYRHSGLSKAQFQTMLCPDVELVQFQKGDSIPVTGNFYIVLDGVVAAVANQVGTTKKRSMPLVSGEMFPLQYMCIDYMPQENVFMNTWITPTAATDVTMYCIPVKRLKELSKNHQMRDAWMALLIATMAVIAERPYYTNQNPFVFVEDEADAIHTTKRNPLFDPLVPSEEPNPLSAGSTHALGRAMAHIWEYCKLSVFIPWPLGSWPVGLRHRLPPPTDPNGEAAIKRRTEDILRRSNQMNNNAHHDDQSLSESISGDGEDNDGEGLQLVRVTSLAGNNLLEEP